MINKGWDKRVPTYHCRTASIYDVNMMLDWARTEDWNPGIYDMLPFLVTDANGFFVGVLDEVPIATISAIRYPNHFGFIGFYIVAPKYRGQGFGFKLWQHGMKYLSGCNIGLDAVSTAQVLYQKSGFSKAHENIRFAGVVSERTQQDLVDVKKIPLNTLLNYDSAHYPAPRSAFLSAWFCMPESHALAFIQNQCLKGYGVIRKSDKGYKIGPLFADNYTIAETLFLGLCEHAKQQTIFLDVPAVNNDALKLASYYHLTSVVTMTRMYTVNQPAIDLNHIYGITSFELG